MTTGRIHANIQAKGRYSNSGTMEFDFDYDDDSDSKISLLAQAEGEAEELTVSTLRAFADWIYYQLREQFEYMNADAQVDEMLRANEYEFTVGGESV